MRMERLDDIVIGEIVEHALDPERLRTLLDACLQSTSERGGRNKHQIDRLRQTHRDTQAALARLLSLVEKGLMDAEDLSLKKRPLALKLQRDELAIEIRNLQQRLSSNESEITPEKIERFATLLREKLLNGTPEFRQAYARHGSCGR